MSNPSPLVVFDLDGTLAETAGDLMGALNHVLSRDGLPSLPVDQARSLLGAGGRALIRRGFAAAGRPLDEARLEDLFRLFLAFYEDHIADHSHLYPGVAEALDRLAYRAIAFAFPLWTFAIVAGAIWAESAWGRYWAWDPKETWAFITWVVYAAYLHARTTRGGRERRGEARGPGADDEHVAVREALRVAIRIR